MGDLWYESRRYVADDGVANERARKTHSIGALEPALIEVST